jgi:hypothetical protein
MNDHAPETRWTKAEILASYRLFITPSFELRRRPHAGIA